MTRPNTAVAGPNYVPKWVREFEWNGITVGQPVKVERELGAYTFVEAHIQDGEAIAIGVRGGLKGNETMRFFMPDRISIIAEKPKRGRKVKAEAVAEADEDVAEAFEEVE